MRWIEIASAVRLPISCEEQELLTKIEDGFPKEQMDEREQELARIMVSRGALNHFMKDEEIHYRPNSTKDIWRDRDG